MMDSSVDNVECHYWSSVELRVASVICTFWGCFNENVNIDEK